MKPTVIFFQKHPNALYFELFIQQAKNFCTSAEIVCITDAYHNCLPCNTFPLSDYEKDANDFSKIYTHLSTNPYEAELICIQRWFVINDFIRRNKIEKFFTPDSDVMIFCDIGQEFEKFNKYDFTLSMGESAGTSFWINPEVMNDFCLFTMNIYQNRDTEISKNIFAHYNNLREKGLPGGVCDMTLWKHFIKYRSYNVGDTTAIINNSTFDHNFYMAYDGYEYNGYNKIIRWNNGIPYCLKDGKDLIRFNTLHLSCRRHLAPMIFGISNNTHQISKQLDGFEAMCMNH